MNNGELKYRLAVCSWSLQPANASDLVTKVQATGIKRVQLALDPLRDSPAMWGQTEQLFADHGLSFSSGMFGCVGEDYSTLDSIRVTGGIAPDATWEQNWKNIQATAALSQRLGLKLVTFHAGFLPHEKTDPHFVKMCRRLTEVADIFERAGIVIGLETGQETATVLAELLKELDHPNLGVNFDPANMILYGKGEPLEGLRVLGKWICQVHVKDANATKVAGTWGEEVPAGQGQVNWTKFFATLEQLRFVGPIVIEREAGNRRIEDIRVAKGVVEKAFPPVI